MEVSFESQVKVFLGNKDDIKKPTVRNAKLPCTQNVYEKTDHVTEEERF